MWEGPLPPSLSPSLPLSLSLCLSVSPSPCLSSPCSLSHPLLHSALSFPLPHPLPLALRPTLILFLPPLTFSLPLSHPLHLCLKFLSPYPTLFPLNTMLPCTSLTKYNGIIYPHIMLLWRFWSSYHWPILVVHQRVLVNSYVTVQSGKNKGEWYYWGIRFFYS